MYGPQSLDREINIERTNGIVRECILHRTQCRNLEPKDFETITNLTAHQSSTAAIELISLLYKDEHYN